MTPLAGSLHTLTAMTWNIRVIRESGGVGDVVRVLPVLAELRKRCPDARLWVYAPEPFRDIYDHSGIPFEFTPTPMGDERRPRLAALDAGRWPYLKAPDGITFDRSIDLYCPAFDYELRMGRATDKERIQLFLEAAELWPCAHQGAGACDALPRYHVRDDERNAAQRFVEQNRLRDGERPLVALQPFSTDASRDWPEAHWVTLANSLKNAGCSVVAFDVVAGRLRRFPATHFAGHPLWFAAAMLAECDLLISPDSGLYHLAAAVGTPALGLFAQQRGDVMARFYPHHDWLSPEPNTTGPKGCRWPCYWSRPWFCARNTLRGAGATCPVLAQLLPHAVLQRADSLLRKRVKAA